MDLVVGAFIKIDLC